MNSSKSHHVRLYRFSQILCVMMVVWYVAVPASVSGYHHFYIQDGTNHLVLKWRTLGVDLVVDQDPMNFQSEVQAAVDTWNNVATAKNVFGSLSQSTTDFTGANFGTAWGMMTADGQQEVVFDADGSALAAVGLDPLTINGFAPTRQRVIGGQGAITDAYFIVNGSRTDFDRLSTLTHELGHVQGLAHSSVGMHNSTSFPSDALDPIAINSVPTMHPFSVGGTARRTLEPDDIAALSELYPEPSFATSFGSIAGKVNRCSNDNAVTGANVRAINTSNTNIQLSRFTGFNGNDQGSFVINGLPPGSYRLVVEPMGANGFSINRFTNAGGPPVTAEMDFPTEYHNPPQEDDCSEELPDSAVNVAVSAGGSATDKNFKVGAVDLAFVIDDTGSMGNEIGAVRTVLSQFVSIMNTITGTLGIPFPNTAIVTFKDNVTKRIISNDPARLQAIISSLSASGGSDCPESSNSALLTAGRLLRRGGVAILFTDADSRANGPDRNTVTQLYRSKSLKLSTLLSGTCSGSISSATPLVEPLSRTALARYSSACEQRGSGIFTNTEEFPLPPTLGFENAVRTFSEISIETGGFFTAIPGIKLGDPTETQRYINTGTNIAVSSVVPAIGLLTPGDGPQGSTLDVEITGSNTNFQSSSAVSFSGDGITINSQTVNSPQSITVNISIQPGATLGFRDVTVTTNLGGSSVETAKGFGAFNVVSPASVPTIIGVSPPQGAQGETLNVSISGATTNFVNGVSTASFGPGITVNSTTVLSSTSAVANITINSAATIGFRDVRVTTGSQIAGENEVGPFLVTAPPPLIPRITIVEPPEGGQGQTLNVTITGENTHFADGTSVASFSGTGITVNSTNVTSATTAVANITIAAGSTLGFRDVFVTTGGEVAVILGAFRVTENTVDTAPPVIACPANIITTTAQGRCSAMVNYVVTATDDNPGVTVVSNPPSGSTFPKGTTTVTSTATDAAGNTSACSFTVTVKDVKPPVITNAAVDKSTLKPPNHKMVNITVSYNLADNCDLPSAITRKLSVTSNEPINGTGDGDTSPDWEILDANHVRLRAERAGKGRGRIYTITITAIDSQGNSSKQVVLVSVPHH